MKIEFIELFKIRWRGKGATLWKILGKQTFLSLEGWLDSSFVSISEKENFWTLKIIDLGRFVCWRKRTIDHNRWRRTKNFRNAYVSILKRSWDSGLNKKFDAFSRQTLAISSDRINAKRNG